MYVCVGQVYIFLSAIPFPTGNGDKILAVVNYDEKILCKYLRDVAGVRTHANTGHIYIYVYICISPTYVRRSKNNSRIAFAEYTMFSRISSLLRATILNYFCCKFFL